ncbi:L-fuco-beta-pyranose dehydrogenase [[Actinomadura] parvosata subsp. kistnae]|uniref:Aldo/keto reductase n=1 Tax=[Actinomadura] parvosata subsp. kistnae TaxID=1909395 RepID=A0A1V0AFM8_9ACTN|nr:aldo/keto reductase [Nonomuraea sp. ATCC 55076]AQZ69015.1 aldo/keto reductase [Nonomuraea sp. ATCC 55076]SPL92421.1 L-fuco-beta-pyranose dehydrogenase [Actinomadura parvosata subsp. kistnae]
MALDLPRHGFGGAPIGNLYDEVAEEQARATVDAAWDSGVRLYDTAPHYGLGLSERRLGAALAGRSGYLLSTKVGRLLRPKASGPGHDDDIFDVSGELERVWDFSAAGVRASLDESLERLGLPSVDIALIHDPDNHADQAIGEAYPALAELRAAGRVRAIGVGMNQWEVPLRFVQETDIDVVMLAGRYTLLDQSGLPLLDECAKRGVKVLAAGVFNSGILATHEPAGTYDYAPAPPRLLERARRIAGICERHDVTLPHAALAFPLRHEAITTIVLGARTPEEVRRNADLWSRPVPEELWADLEGEGLLAAGR